MSNSTIPELHRSTFLSDFKSPDCAGILSTESLISGKETGAPAYAGLPSPKKACQAIFEVCPAFTLSAREPVFFPRINEGSAKISIYICTTRDLKKEEGL
jgi:hypothetical protein